MTESPDVFLNDFGVAVTFGSSTGKGILDQPTEIIAGGMVLTTDYQLTVKTSDFTGMDRGDSITVAGSTYTIREVRAVDDGVFSHVFLSKAA